MHPSSWCIHHHDASVIWMHPSSECRHKKDLFIFKMYLPWWCIMIMHHGDESSRNVTPKTPQSDPAVIPMKPESNPKMSPVDAWWLINTDWWWMFDNECLQHNEHAVIYQFAAGLPMIESEVMRLMWLGISSVIYPIVFRHWKTLATIFWRKYVVRKEDLLCKCSPI